MRYFGNKNTLIRLIGLAAATLILLISFLPSQPYSRLNTMVFDSYQRLNPRVWNGSDIVIVDIDERSIDRLGQWPWPRSVIAQLTDQLGELGAAAIVFDIVFSEPDRTSPLRAVDELSRAGAQIELPSDTSLLDNDQVLAQAIARHTVVTGMILSANGSADPPKPKAGLGFSGTPPPSFMENGLKSIRNLAVLDEAATGIGEFSFDAVKQNDAVVRRAALMRGANGNYYPSLAAETLRVVQGAGGFKIKSSDGSGEIDSGELAIVSVQIGAVEVPTDKDGALTIYHSTAASKPTLSARSVLFPQENNLTKEKLSQEVANHIVLIGTSAAGLLDLRATPLEPVVAGVTIHAEILDQILAGAFLSRPDTALGIERMVAIVLCLILLALLPHLNALWDGVLTIGLIGAAIAGCWLAFTNWHMLLSPVVSVFMLLGTFAVGVAANLLVTDREGRYVRQAFGMYLAPAMVKKLADNPDALKLGGEDKELTLLFCDIRGFTTLSEGLDPVELTELLNNFLTPMTDALLAKGATIDKYMGDAIMAFWNAPIDQADHRRLACEGLLAMRSHLHKLNATAKRPIDIGIGLNTGRCCVGNLGSTQRFNYSAIGDAVNVASRIEGLTKQYGLDNLVAAETLADIEDYATLEIDSVGVVGRSQALTVHTIYGKGALKNHPEFLNLRDHHGRMIDAYKAGDVEEGLVAMAQANRVAARLHDEIGGPSLIKLYALYAERLGTMRDSGVPAEWDGIYRATSK